MKKKLSKLEKKYNCDYDLIIKLYTMGKTYLTKKQLDDYLKLRGEKKYPHYVLEGKRQVII